MEVSILFETPTLEGMEKRINIYFKQAMKIHREGASIFETYQIRPKEKFIPEIWKYRIVGQKGKFIFGTKKVNLHN
jgi:hypothetical protein